MSKRLEDFVRENRSNFDRFDPPSDVWEKIETRLQTDITFHKVKKERVVRLSFLLKAAAVLILITSGVMIWHFQYNSSHNLISSVNPELAKQQIHYVSLIEEKRSELELIRKDEPRLYQAFSSELKKIDLNYQQLKQELPNSPNQERTIKAMIKNREIQLQLLNQQLIIIQQLNGLKKQKNNGAQSI
jgi:hypothetical protein